MHTLTELVDSKMRLFEEGICWGEKNADILKILKSINRGILSVYKIKMYVYERSAVYTTKTEL